MARILKNKELTNLRLATNYGGWMYCTSCNQNIGYLCYVTYDSLKFTFTCNCGSRGSAFIDFEDTQKNIVANESLIEIKNRLSCPFDESPLITVLSKKLQMYELEISCKDCHKLYKERGILK